MVNAHHRAKTSFSAPRIRTACLNMFSHLQGSDKHVLPQEEQDQGSDKHLLPQEELNMLPQDMLIMLLPQEEQGLDKHLLLQEEHHMLPRDMLTMLTPTRLLVSNKCLR